MKALPKTPRHRCERCRRVIEPRKAESKYSYGNRRKCDRCVMSEVTKGPRFTIPLLDHWRAAR